MSDPRATMRVVPGAALGGPIRGQGEGGMEVGANLSSMGATRRKATYADIEALPDNLVGELLDGELVVSPRPRIRHGIAGSALGMLLGGPFQFGRGGPGGWWVLDEPELHLGPDVLVPDLAGWRRERMPSPPDVVGVELPPDWVAEVVSPSTARYDRVVKLRIYARAGVSHAWLLDPAARTLEIFERAGPAWTRVGAWMGDEQVRAVPFEAVELALSDLWIPETPAVSEAGPPGGNLGGGSP